MGQPLDTLDYRDDYPPLGFHPPSPPLSPNISLFLRPQLSVRLNSLTLLTVRRPPSLSAISGVFLCRVPFGSRTKTITFRFVWSLSFTVALRATVSLLLPNSHEQICSHGLLSPPMFISWLHHAYISSQQRGGFCPAPFWTFVARDKTQLFGSVLLHLDVPHRDRRTLHSYDP